MISVDTQRHDGLIGRVLCFGHKDCKFNSYSCLIPGLTRDKQRDKEIKKIILKDVFFLFAILCIIANKKKN